MSIELLSPAGDMEKLKMALAYGADAVYLAGKNYGLRAGTGNFIENELDQAAALAHAQGAKAYITLNSVARDYELDGIAAAAEHAQSCGFDAAIVSDAGVLDMVKRNAPNLAVHISTQAGVTNSASARMWYSMGAERIILARELSLDEIASIRANTPSDLDIEVFVHGAMCVSFSGRCLLSNYMTGRDGNRGECAQPCRWKYALVEEQHPDEYFEITEHKEGTYILNSRDMCAIRFLDQIIKAGATSLKIEGRSKSAYYAAAVTRAYRGALDDVNAGKPFDDRWYDEVCKSSHRPFCDGFFFAPRGGMPTTEMQFHGDSRYIREWQVCAVVEESDGEFATVSLKNPFAVGEPLELVQPNQESRIVTIDEMYEVTEDGNVPVTSATKNQIMHRLRLPNTSECAFLHKPRG